MKEILKKIGGNALVRILMHAFCLNLFIEAASRHSVGSAASFMVRAPGPFFYNMLMITVTLSVTLLFRHRVFIKVILSLFWIMLGTVNGVILSFRMTPFTVSDLSLLENGLSILPNYMSTRGMIFVILGMALGIGALVLTFLFAPKLKERVPYKVNATIIVVLALGLWGLTGVGLNHQWLSTYFPNLAYAYADYGVPYCFFNTWLNKGVARPTNYSEEEILNIERDGIPPGIPEANSKIPVLRTVTAEPRQKPNIVFVQLESFIDPTRLKGVAFSTDPVPYFHHLKRTGSTGRLLVPAVGAGTANTEFEVLTGMRIMAFGPGEYPYKTVIKEQPCESINYVLKKSGYHTHAIHNHRGAFYGRNEVFANLGFDTFTSVEYMNRVRLTPQKWAKDGVLEGEIEAAMQSTAGPDFVFTISVQGHGSYPTEKRYVDADMKVRLTSPAKDEASKNQREYYLQQVYDMDQLIGKITKAFAQYPEPTVVVFYGDHIPVLDIAEEDFVNSTIYETEYAVWSNFGLRKIDGDMTAFQLYPKILEWLGFHNGILTWFHQTQKEKPDYMNNLEALQYDMLYGRNYVYGGANPFKPTALQMGVRPIRVTKIFNFGSSTYVIGQNFTPNSKVALKGKFVKTTFVNARMLRVVDKIGSLNPADFSVSQVGKYNAVLSTIKDVLREVE